MGKKKPETASEMLESLNDFLLGDEPDFKGMPEEEVAAYLEKSNLDSEQVFKAVHRALAKARGQQELAQAHETRRRIQESLPGARAATGLRQSLLEQIRALAGAGAAEVYARKFEEAPDEDLRSLIEDFELLDQLDLGDDAE